MPRLLMLCLVLVLANSAAAQNRVRTETIRPPAPTAQPQAPNAPPALQPDIITDLASLPPPVARMHARILEAARSGDLARLVTAMQTNETMPIFSFGKETDPIAYWRANYPDSGGVEVLAILVSILKTGFVRIDRGTPQEMYVWPYFAFTPLKTLTPAQKVELFRIVTGADYQAMMQFGAYTFYRLGIAPDGTWHFLVSGR